MLSIVIPTYKEHDNLVELIPLLQTTLTQAVIPFEIIIVDDNSQDGTDQLVKNYKKSVRLIVRTNQRGLSSAVYDGLQAAKGDILCFMDADLSHPVSALPGMFKRIQDDGLDVVVGSRLVPGGGSDKWPWHRQVISNTARMMALPLTTVKDVTSGFFMFRKTVLPKDGINLKGFKIGLEILVKGKFARAGEYPIVFQDRKHGESKLSGKVMLEYLKQLGQLYAYWLKRAK